MRRNDLAKIHIAKKDLGLNEGEYRDVLWTVCRVRTSAELDVAGRAKLLQHFKSRGWRPKRKAPKSQGQIVDKIRAIWITMHKAGHIRDGSEAALCSYGARITAKHNNGSGVEQIEWLRTDNRLSSIVLANLQQWQRRAAKE